MNLTTLIGTCDSYSSLWEPFQITFNRYWKLNTENIFVGETVEVPHYTDTKFTTILSESETWGARMRKGIESCKTDYIFFILEDYFFNYSYTEKQLQDYLEICDKHNIDRLQISPSGHQLYSEIEVDGVVQFSNNSEYLISMQPSIWRKSFLYEVLLPEYSPWDFEIEGSHKMLKEKSNIFIDKKVPSVYFNAVRKGKSKSPGWKEFFIQQNIVEPF